VSSNVYNAFHQVTTNYNALGEATVYTYNNDHQLTSITRPSGLITTNIYDGNGRLQQTIDLPINRSRSYTWYSDGNVKSFTDERGLTVTNFWDGLNRLTGTVYPDGATTTNLYTIGATKILDVTAIKDRGDHWTYFGYDGLRRKVAETNANNVITRWGYCECGAIASTTNAWNTAVEQATTFHYDFQGNLLRTVYADGYSVTNWYNALGKRIVSVRWTASGFLRGE
jgi:YD repeat-containing protein